MSETFEHAAAAAVSQEIKDHELAVNQALLKMSRRTSYEPSTDRTPLDDILRSEASPKCPHCDKPIEDSPELEQWGIRIDTIKHFSDFICQDGLQPWNVLRNLYAVFSHMSLEPWVLLTLREKALILGDSHGSQHFRMEKLVNLLRRKGAHSIKAPGQKRIETRAKFSECQQGNTNRKRQKRSRHRHWKKKEGKQKRNE
jgi:hypothetical protein